MRYCVAFQPIGVYSCRILSTGTSVSTSMQERKTGWSNEPCDKGHDGRTEEDAHVEDAHLRGSLERVEEVADRARTYGQDARTA